MSGVPKNFQSLLVIDDHNMVVNGIKLLIGHQFADLYQANDGVAGIKLALKYQPQLVIIDYVLREMP